MCSYAHGKKHDTGKFALCDVSRKGHNNFAEVTNSLLQNLKEGDGSSDKELPSCDNSVFYESACSS